MASTETRVEDIEIRITSIEHARSTDSRGSGAGSQTEEEVWEHTKSLEDELANFKLAASMPTATPSTGNTDDAFKLVGDALWSKGAPYPVDHYVKGEFNGILFLKFTSKVDRDIAVKTLKEASIQHGSHNAWAKPDLPLDARANQSFLFSAKRMMTEWGYDRKSDELLECQWNFRSCLGRLRRLDYVMVSSCASFHSAKPTNMLDLGSDHRAAQARLQAPALAGQRSRRKRRQTRKDVDWEMYAAEVPQKIAAQEFPPASLGDVERVALLAAGESQRPRLPAQQSSGGSHLGRLRRRRRRMTNPSERRDISKEIWRLSQKESRARQTARTTEVLASFSDLRRLDALRRFPIARSSQQGPDFRKCADLLSEIYTSSAPPDAGEHGEGQVPAVTVEEVVKTVKAMRRRKAADTKGALSEMSFFGGDDMLHYLSDMFNAILQSGCVPADWRETFFKLLHEGGGAADPHNWRPIAILSVSYKILARVVFHRIRGVLDSQQSEEQFGFQRDRSTADTLIVAESLASKSLEFNEDLWLVSVDLRKAFDRGRATSDNADRLLATIAFAVHG
ncbi:unnamed protein product [Prorocentrum cordatum]|uniref:Reverse transcriptase domain-containing protein n=1 Tax=Prorocentrum cordatum TaxID=2364126 RepID=A0ABN9R2Z4_9DINO|nr:unnamed protein product [Polarella glacialis]